MIYGQMDEQTDGQTLRDSTDRAMHSVVRQKQAAKVSLMFYKRDCVCPVFLRLWQIKV